MKYGFRVTRSWLIGLALTALWFLIWSAFGDGPHWPAFSALTFSAALLVFVLWPLETFMPKRNRYLHGVLSASVVTGVLYAVLSGSQAAWSIQNTAGINAVLNADYLGRAAWFFVAGLVLTYGGPLAVYVKERLNENEAVRDWAIDGRGPASRWAGPGTFSKYPDDLDHNRTTPHVFVGYSRFEENLVERPVYLDDESNLIAVATSGSGKSVCYVWPIMATYSGPLIAVDPKGEHTKMFFERRQEVNDEALVLDPKNQTGRKTDYYNLLSETDLTKSEECRKRISAITSSCILLTGGDNQFWQEASRQVLDGLIVEVLRYPKECHNLPFVLDLLIGKDPEMDPEKRDKVADATRMKKLHAQMRVNNAAGGLAQQAATMLDEVGEKGYGYIISELLTALKWTTDEDMRPQLTHSSFRFADFEKKLISLFIALPFGDMVEQSRWLRSITNLSFRIFESFETPLNPRLLYILDELRYYGQDLINLELDANILRERGVRLFSILQSRAQLDKCLGKEGADAFESGSTVITFGFNDLVTSEWGSKKLGQHLCTKKVGRIGKRHKETHRVDVMEASTLTRKLQRNKPLAIVFSPDGSPMLLERMAFKPLKINKRRFRGLDLEGTYPEQA